MSILNETVARSSINTLPGTEEKARSSVPESGAYDAIIIGGGPAGSTAGVYLARKQLKTLLISPDLGGQVLWTSEIENYPGYEIISGIELAHHFQEQLKKQEIDLKIGDSVVAIQPAKTGGTVLTDKEAKYAYRTLIIASGKRSRPLDVAGENALIGRGVTYCATCDGPLYRGEEVAVVGGGNSALTAAIELLALGCTVHLVNIMPGLQADGSLIDKARSSNRLTMHLDHEVTEILGDKAVAGITIRNRETGELIPLGVTGVFVETGLIPNSTFAKGVVRMNEKNEIMVNCLCETSVPGIFAAGDVTNVPEKQIVVAAGEGAKAALGASEYLMRLK